MATTIMGYIGFRVQGEVEARREQRDGEAYVLKQILDRAFDGSFAVSSTSTSSPKILPFHRIS